MYPKPYTLNPEPYNLDHKPKTGRCILLPQKASFSGVWFARLIISTSYRTIAGVPVVGSHAAFTCKNSINTDRW